MSGLEVGVLAVLLMFAAIYIGMHIGVALIAVSFVSITIMRTPELAARMVGAAANDALQDYLFGVVPLFVLMGLLVSVSGVGRDTFDVAQWALRRFRGGLGVATVASNAVFAAITGISIASASVFTKVAVPEMIRHHYTPRFAVGVVAGSSVLGMLIPPSLLMIIYGVLSEESIGRMFIAGIIPGALLALSFCAMIVWMAHFKRDFMFADAAHAGEESQHRESAASALRKGLPIALLVGLVLGGLYAGIFTPTEAGAVGAAGAFMLALLRRSLDLRKFWQVLVETGQVSVSVLFLILAASLYSRMLAFTGLPGAIAQMTSGLGAYGFLMAYIAIVVLLGCIIDSVSIMLIMLPIVLPIASQFGMDLIWFGVITVVAVEIGLLTPPFGISVYTVKATLNDPRVPLVEIFKGALPFVLCMFVVLAILIAFPQLSTWLARMQ